MFEFFKKKKNEEEIPQQAIPPHYDPTNIKISDIRKGFLLDYDLQTWEVTDEFEFDWGDYCFSYEYKLRSVKGDEIYVYIEQEEGGIPFLKVSKRMNLHKIGEHIANEIIRTGKPPIKIVFEGATYHREKESPGYFRNIHTTPADRSAEFVVWDYLDETEKKVISIEQYGDEDFDASVGYMAKEYEFSNILPSSN